MSPASPNKPSAVTCRAVAKDFGDGDSTVRVLHEVDVDFYAGELSLLVGPSGCGKTTLISIIGGILSATSGTITVFDESVSRLRGAALSKFRLNRIGFIFQQYNLMPSLTAAENAAVPLAASGEKRHRAVANAKELLARLDLSAHVDKLPSQLSGGQQQRVAIARSLINSPRLVVCDEPTAALDAKSGQRVLELLREVAVAQAQALQAAVVAIVEQGGARQRTLR